MIQRASYRRLLGNGRAALLAAIEIYNKPRIEYRDECFVILLLNAWELTLKALLAKNQQPVFYKKRRGEPRRTYSLTDALRKAEVFIPASLVRPAISANLGLLTTYRDNSVHFYNAKNFGSIIYALAQTSIINLKDLLSECFSVDLAEDITWHLLPLGIDSPIDPIEYISGKTQAVSASNAVKQFLAQIATSTQELESKNLDTARLLTVFSVKLESTKKITNADLVVGINASASPEEGPLVVTKSVDPNVSHPLRQKEVLAAINASGDKKFTSHTFQAIAWKHGLKERKDWCWRSSTGEVTKYSHSVIQFLKSLTAGDIQLAVKEYKQKNTKKKPPATATLNLLEGAVAS